MKRFGLLILSALALLLAPAASAIDADVPELTAGHRGACPAPAADSVELVATVPSTAGVDGAFVEALRLQTVGEACCRAQRLRCEGQCALFGVFEFSCNPDSCPRGVSCICNIG